MAREQNINGPGHMTKMAAMPIYSKKIGCLCVGMWKTVTKSFNGKKLAANQACVLSRLKKYTISILKSFLQ